VLYSGVACITDLMVKEGLINLDFADVRAIMREMGKAMMGTGEASGERRAIHAAEAAIANPLLDEVSMKGARGLLISITGGNDLTLYEVDEAASRIRQEVDEDANIILGATFDSSLDGVVRVSVVATGIDHPVNAREFTATQDRIAAVTQKLLDQTQPRGLQQPVTAAAPAPSYEMQAAPVAAPVMQQPAAQPAMQPPVMPAGHGGVELQPMAPKPAYAPHQAPEAPRQADYQQPGAFMPPVAEQPMRAPRMPSIEDLPRPGQDLMRAQTAPAPDTRRRSLFDRLIGANKPEEPPAQRSAQAPQQNFAPRPPQAPAPVHQEYGKRPAQPQAPRPPQGALDPHGRPAPQQRSIEEDQLEIPAFLRRQSN
jgi:cell division protein FtsZ